jgi:hypothetical protein
MRWLLLVLACLGAIALFLLATASANTELFAQQIDVLLVVNGVLGALLVAVVGAQLWRLWEKRRTGVFGYRLAVRLVLVFALVSVLPGALVYAASVMFIGRSIESWFDVRVDRALEGGLNPRPQRARLSEAGNRQQGEPDRAHACRGGQGPISTRLNRAAEQAGVYEASLFTSTGGVLAVAGIGGSTATPEPPTAAALRRARLQQSTATRSRPRTVSSPSCASWCRSTPTISSSRSRCCSDRARAEGACAGLRDASFRLRRLPEDLTVAAGIEAPLRADAHADAAPCADVRAGSRRRAVGTHLGAARIARGRHARRRAGRLSRCASR